MRSKVHARDNYWKKNKNGMIHVLLPPYSPKSIQYIVSAGQIVFELDKKPAVQSLFCKTDFQHCRWFPFNRKPSHFICVYKHRCENPNRLFHIIVSEHVSGHLPKKKAVGVGIKGGEFTYYSTKCRELSSVQERGGVIVGEEVALKHGDAYSTWQAEKKTDVLKHSALCFMLSAVNLDNLLFLTMQWQRLWGFCFILGHKSTLRANHSAP